MSTRACKLLTAKLLSASMILVAANASADESLQMRSYSVSYADLNLAQPTDIEALHERIRSAAKLVCARGDRLTLSKVVRERECRAEAISKATAQVRNAQLAALGKGAADQG